MDYLLLPNFLMSSSNMLPHGAITSRLIFAKLLFISATRLAASAIQFSNINPSHDNMLFLTALCGPSLNGPKPVPPKSIIGPPARYTPWEMPEEAWAGRVLAGRLLVDVAVGSGSSPTGEPGVIPFAMTSCSARSS